MKKFLILLVLLYLRTLAKVQLLKTHPIIIGIAGSSGKSSLGRILTGVLQDKYAVDSSKEKNSETGIPLHILNLHMETFSYLAWIKVLLLAPLQLLLYWPKIDIFIAEMGIDSPVEPKNMSYLLKIVQPTIGVVTNVSLEHSVYFEPYVSEINPKAKQEKILTLTAEQETMLLTSLPETGTAIVNADDPSVLEVVPSIRAKKITVSTKTAADLMAKDCNNANMRFSMDVVYQKKSYPITIHQPLPKHFAYEFLFALGVALAVGIDLPDAIISLEKHFVLPSGRLSFFKGIKDTVLIDSSYNNATLPPILDILDFVKEIGGRKRKVAILGDMRELGEEAQGIHEAVAQKVLQTVDFAVLIGPMSEQYMVPILKAAHFPFENFPDVTSSKKAITSLIKSGDVILVKGSQNTLFLERIVEMLLENKKDASKLTRRGAFWDKMRSESL